MIFEIRIYRCYEAYRTGIVTRDWKIAILSSWAGVRGTERWTAAEVGTGSNSSCQTLFPSADCFYIVYKSNTRYYRIEYGIIEVIHGFICWLLLNRVSRYGVNIIRLMFPNWLASGLLQRNYNGLTIGILRYLYNYALFLSRIIYYYLK